MNDCKSIYKDIGGCQVVFVRRSANEAAHSLAMVALSMSGREEWVDTPPQSISDVLYLDSN